MSTPPTTDASVLPIAFRDTALTVASLGWQATPVSFESLRYRSHAQLRQLRAELKSAGQPEDVIQDAVYAQCALLDETALRHLNDQDREAWEREPLQVTEFGTHDAGDTLIVRIQQRLQQPQPAWSLLAIFHAALALGFRGRLALEAQDTPAALIQALAERLGISEHRSDGVIVGSATHSLRWSRLSLPIAVLLALVAAVLVWVWLSHWLDTLAAQLLH